MRDVCYGCGRGRGVHVEKLVRVHVKHNDGTIAPTHMNTNTSYPQSPCDQKTSDSLETFSAVYRVFLRVPVSTR